MLINKKIKLAILGLFLIIPSSIIFAQDSSSNNPCKQPWSPSTGGVSHQECPNGLHYPSFNAYNDSNFLKTGNPTPEYEFAWVRDFKEDLADYENEYRKGFKESYYLNSEEDIAETYFYIHNSGDPACNTQNNNNKCDKSTIAKDAKIKISGLKREGNKYISTGVISNNQKIHTLTATINASNTTPRTLTDTITIITPKDKNLELDIDNYFLACQPNSTRDYNCTNTNELILNNSDLNQLFSNGLNVNSTYANASNKSGFYASEGYRMGLYLFFFTVDAPEEQNICEGITATRTSGSLTSPNQTFRITFDPNEKEFHDNFEAQITGGGQLNFNFVDRFALQDYTNLQLNNLTQNSVVTVRSKGSSSACSTRLTFEDIPPTEQKECKDLQIIEDTTNTTNDTFVFSINTNPLSFLSKANVTATQGTLEYLGDNKYRLTNVTSKSTITAKVDGEDDCQDQRDFTPNTTIDDSCKELNIVVDPSKTTETSVTFDVVTTPGIYATKARIETTNGTRTPSTPPTQTISNITSKTTITAFVPGEENCKDTLEFTPTPPPPGGEACRAITINTDTYDYQQNPRPTFEVTSKNPADFEANFIWTVKGQTGNTIEVRQGQDLLSFRPQNQLTGNETIHVEVEDANNPNCQKDISSSKPPVEKICKDLQVVRILNPQLRRTIPNNGQPAIFRLNVGEYEGTITFQSDSDPRLTTFLSNNQRSNGKITVNPDDTVIILNRAENATIRVFASDENQYTQDCYLELKADSDDEGDKLTDIDKTVDRSFATNGDILNYTIKYTISPIFGDPNFKDALDGLDTAILKDNINLIYGIQDTLINPLEATDTRLIPLDLTIPASLQATGDLFGVEGLVIEDLTEKAGKTYTITYAARLDADIIQDCLTITSSCGFEFPNTASDNFGNEDTASVLATCPFVISRSFGDVFLEEEFENTIDISSCTNRRSSDGPVFTPQPQKPRELISSGTGILSAPSHRICQESIKQNPDLPSDLDGYKNPLQNFSSGVCEVSLFTSSNWTSEDIEKSLRSNVSRYSNVTNLNNTNQLSDLNQNSLTTFDTLNPNPQNKVYRKTNGSLTITSDSTLIQNDNQAKTIIVEGNDLIINQNITYGANQNTLFPSQIAFIVIGGDVVVGPNVTDIQGVIVAVPDANGNGGFIRRSEQTDKLLTLRGSIFGDSGPLFSGTSNPGDLQADKGAVTVIYDSNIIINTPPALQSIVQFNQYQTVR